MNSTHGKSAPSAELDLVERARSGDHRAFAELVDRHDGSLRTLARRFLRDRDQIDDVMQEAYLKAFRNLGRFRADSTLATWLYRITYNACLDELRRRPCVVAPGEDVETPCRSTGPAETAVAKLELTEVLGRLGPELASTVVLVHGYGLDYAGASEVLGVPEGTVASRLNRARSRARRAAGAAPAGVTAHAA